jgi:DNA gyrase subunit A
MILRMRAGDVRAIGRATQGVRLIGMEEGDAVVSLAKLAEKEEEPVNGVSGEAVAQEQEEEPGSGEEQ